MKADTVNGFRVVEWLPDASQLRYADYWNDEGEEQQKPFWVLSGDFRSMETYLAATGMPDQLAACANVARNRFGRVVGGVGVDLAAGTLWAAPHLFRLGQVDLLYCVEYSRHRLFKLGPAVLAHYGVPADRVVLALGDVHHLDLPDESVDFVLMSAAFHHSDTPDVLLKEIRRVLRRSGIVLLIGEHISEIRASRRLKHMAKYLTSRLMPTALQMRLLGRTVMAQRFYARDEELLGGDDRLGDHAYTLLHYERMFTAAGFSWERLHKDEWAYQAFVLAPAIVE